MGKVTLEKDTKLYPANHKNRDILEVFLNKHLNNISPNFYISYWVKKVFEGASNPPANLEGAAEMIKFVSQNKGGIGYVWKNDLTGKENDIKILSISK